MIKYWCLTQLAIWKAIDKYETGVIEMPQLGHKLTQLNRRLQRI